MQCEQKLSCPLTGAYVQQITDARSICEKNHSVVTYENVCRAHPYWIALHAHPDALAFSDDLLLPQRGQHGIRVEP